jgi:alpha-tubulin suppressor-like RCC1 family protein
MLALPTRVPSLVGTRVHSVSAGSAHSLVLTEAGAVLSFGLGAQGCLGHGDQEHQRTPK